MTRHEIKGVDGSIFVVFQTVGAVVTQLGLCVCVCVCVGVGVYVWVRVRACVRACAHVRAETILGTARFDSHERPNWRLLDLG